MLVLVMFPEYAIPQEFLPDDVNYFIMPPPLYLELCNGNPITGC
jgi:hypothetical protein